MRNIIKGSLASVLLITVLLTIGCSKENLDPVPKTSLSDLTVFDTKDRVVAQVNGMYAFMKTGAFLGGRYYVYNDVRAENFIPKSSNLVTNYATWNHTVLPGTNEVQNLWGAVYAAMNAINVFKGGLETAWADGKLTGKVTAAEYDQYLSEALTLRAMCYFYLLQLYAKPYNMNAGDNPGLPLRLIANKTAADNDLARSKVSEVYTQILKDLNDAEPLAVASYSSDLLNTTRVHKNTIIAFKTRVYLHMSNWPAVLTESAKIVSAAAPYTAPSGVAHTLNPGFKDIWATPYTSKESIFSMPFTTTNTPGGQNGLAHYHHPSSSESYYLIKSAGSTYSKIDDTDARKLLMVTDGDGRTFVGKWRDFTTLTDYAPVMRYAEILLTYAEAIVRQGNSVTQGAVNLLNAVRMRSFPDGEYALEDFTTVQNFIDAVLLERSIEFLGEGIRNMDLMRTISTIPAKAGGNMGDVSTIAPNSPTYIWPIPQNELNFNKLMVQN